MDAFVAMTEGGPRQTKMKFMDLAPYEELWARIRSVYSVFESGMLSGTARVYDHQIPGGQYSNLLVQCNSLGMYGDKWETVLDTYRDVNMLFGDIIKVTPSSKCVGDLALFLVNRGLTCEDLKDPVKGAAVDFPESVVGLFKGDLGFPHRGFPSEIEKIVLRGQKKRTGRAGVQLPPVDMKGNIKSLSEKFGIEVSEEEAMSSLMYPKVFADYIKKQMSGRRMLTHVPSAEYFYGMAPGEHFSFSAPVSLLKEVFVDPSKASEGMGPEESVEVTVSLVRVGPLQKSHRTVEIKLTSKTKAGATVTEKQSVSVKDTAGVFHYDGPMANPAKKTDQEYEIASPMPGQVIELLAHTDDAVKAGDILAVISAMKMEVKVSAPRDGTIKSISVAHVGAKVVEGALLVTLGPAP
uniref:Lipoyl-binding domain-containing protein n=1 Tax=Chromera velia CCMP2878 TaxID=1169474 RepID=A0A0G4GPU4_9ALVE|eukprot:Cvel_5027.t1-p1 / transcript=Cvel_5027.t1 / gene=Cvel_5027 / organism=Chromera_velia_CCMP2878 / gene_product=Pyruvate carboxylase, putative / transcript_product=Pyruvate carboxylase, putative / location=Cvel_scaffold228:109000-112494(-) / protein_length=407 / sequence_SO=supercontig / SO=protein_coding / is_pseudo=false